MAQVRIQEAASYRIDEIYRYTRERGGTRQANRFVAVAARGGDSDGAKVLLGLGDNCLDGLVRDLGIACERVIGFNQEACSCAHSQRA